MSARRYVSRVCGVGGAALVLLLGAAGAEAIALPTIVAAPGHPHKSITLVGLGDSVTAASNCDCAGFITDYAGSLGKAADAPVTEFNLGQDGETSGGLRATLEPGRAAVDPVARADVVVITIGANDFNGQVSAMRSGKCGGAADLDCTVATLAAMSRNVDAVLDRIRALHDGAPVTVLVTGYWNVFEDGDVARGDYPTAFRTASDLLTRRVNAALHTVCAAKKVRYVDIYTPFKGNDGDADDTRLLASDGDHPDAAGHRVIADALARAS
ncbi:MAG TPA: SGNH/GDSL hydrolase family protein [Mycobacteriales bacterium]|jgi:lysophospholipase L1-like esterase|nr:SGNH/GDSL hydrolase family protein [Mycobacteriales bacterium]